MRVLIIEDEAAISEYIGSTLISENVSVEVTDLGEEGISLAKLYDFDAIVLDLSLPDITGFETLRQLRRAGIKTPVIALAAGPIDLVTDIVRLLKAGADDYMTKPFNNIELAARLRALVRRSKGLAQSIIATGDLSLDLYSQKAAVRGSEIKLTGKEYAILELLSLRKGRALSQEVIMSHLYGGMDEPEIKIIDVFVCKLRRKLSDASEGNDFIETVWGRGYVLRDPDSKTASMAADVADFADDPPTGIVPNITLNINKRGAHFIKKPHTRRPEDEAIAKGVRIHIPAT